MTQGTTLGTRYPVSVQLPDGGTAEAHTASPTLYEDEGVLFPFDAVVVATKQYAPNKGGLSMVVRLGADRLEINGDQAESLLQMLRRHYTVQTRIGEVQGFWEDAMSFIPFKSVTIVQKTDTDLRIRGCIDIVSVAGQASQEFLARLRTYHLCTHLLEEDAHV